MKKKIQAPQGAPGAISVTQPLDLLAAIETDRKARGETRSQWIGEAAKLRLPGSAVSQLAERGPVGRPPRAKS